MNEKVTVHMYMTLGEFTNLREGNVCEGYSKGVLNSQTTIHVEVPLHQIESIENLGHGICFVVNPTLSE